MLRKIKRWFYDHFLPMWAKESLLKDLLTMERGYEEKCQELEKLKAYMAGMEAGLRKQRRIVINTTGEVRK